MSTIAAAGAKAAVPKRFLLTERLYSGAFSVVHRARDLRTLREVALKRCCDDAHARREFRALSDLAQSGCRNVAALELDRLVGEAEVDPGALPPGPYRSRSPYYDHPATIALPLYCRAPPPVCETDLDVRWVMHDVLRALADVHSAGYVHCDVKRENLVADPEDGEFRLIDFGLALEAGAAARSRAVRGTPFYLAPELVRLGETTPAVDEYAAGVLAYSLLHGLRHFVPAVNLARSGRDCARAVAWSSYSPGDWGNERAPLAADLCEGLLRADPRRRTTARRALEHPLFDGLR
jgi:serine/threonine protein kinase